MKSFVMTHSRVFVEKLLQVGVIPEMVVSNNPFYFYSSFSSHVILKKLFGILKYCLVRFLKLPGYEIYLLGKKQDKGMV